MKSKKKIKFASTILSGVIAVNTIVAPINLYASGRSAATVLISRLQNPVCDQGLLVDNFISSGACNGVTCSELINIIKSIDDSQDKYDALSEFFRKGLVTKCDSDNIVCIITRLLTSDIGIRAEDIGEIFAIDVYDNDTVYGSFSDDLHQVSWICELRRLSFHTNLNYDTCYRKFLNGFKEETGWPLDWEAEEDARM